MSNNLADLLSVPVALKVAVKGDDGRPTGEILEYLVHPLNFGDHAGIQRWIDSQFPDPYDAAWAAINRAREAGRPFNVAQEQFILKDAGDRAMKPRNLIGTPAASELLLSTEGVKRIMLAGIQKGDPSFDEARADELVKHMTPGDIMRAYAATQMELVMSDPKARPPDEPPSSTPTGSTASRRARRAARAKASRGGKS